MAQAREEKLVQAFLDKMEAAAEMPEKSNMDKCRSTQPPIVLKQQAILV